MATLLLQSLPDATEELWLRKQDSLSRLEAWLMQEREKEARRPRREIVKILPKANNKYGVPSNTAEYVKLAQRDYRAKRRKEGKKR